MLRTSQPEGNRKETLLPSLHSDFECSHLQKRLKDLPPSTHGGGDRRTDRKKQKQDLWRKDGQLASSQFPRRGEKNVSSAGPFEVFVSERGRRGGGP